MYYVSKEIHFCYGHRLMHYDGACKNLHGHNGKVEIHLKKNTLDKRHILHDFGDIKQMIKSWIDETLDHKMLLCKNDPLAKTLRKLGEPVYLFETNPTAEAIAKLIYDECALKKLPIDEVKLWETETSWASYTKTLRQAQGTT